MPDRVQTTPTRRHNWLFIVAFGVALTLAACGGGSKIDPLEIGDPERGREIHETGGGVIGGEWEVGCSSCHTLDGSVKTPVAIAAPSFQGISERAGERVPGMSAEEYLRQSIVDPSAYVVEGFGNLMQKDFESLLSEEDIDSLVAFLLTQ
jgi:hypothetical protein